MPHMEVPELIRELKRQGFEVEDGGSHYKVVHPGRTGKATIPKTPGDHRWFRNAMSSLRKLGMVAPADFEDDGRSEKWREQRAELEAVIAEPEPSVGPGPGYEEDAEQLRHQSNQIARLPAKQRELYDAIAAEEGLQPMVYAERLGQNPSNVSQKGMALKKAGLIEVRGNRINARYWLTGHVEGQLQPPATPPPSGGVRVRRREAQNEAEAIRYAARRLLPALEEVTKQAQIILSNADKLGEERDKAVARAKRLEKAIGKVVDEL